MAEPERLGNYHIKGILGEGGMGVVYLGLDESLNRHVAIKTIKRELLHGRAGRELMQRFQREAQAEGRLNHPNIVSVYEFHSGEESGTPFFAMEYVKGESLKEILSRGMHFNLDMSLHIIEQALSALSHSHGQGVIHRDIKPANIMLLEDDSVKIADFGIARMEESEYTQTGQVMGTPQYFSPEQGQGFKTDARSDLYSTGIVFFELLTGQKMFGKPAESGGTHRLTEEHLEKLSNYPADIKKELRVVLQKALARQPDKRYQTAEEFERAIRQIVRMNEPQEMREDKRGFWITIGAGLAGIAAIFLLARYAPELSRTIDDFATPPRAEAPPAELTVEDRERRDRYLKIGRTHLMVNRLIVPQGSNAHHAYSIALQIDPANPEAQEGLAAVHKKLLAQLQTDLDSGNDKAVREQLTLAQRLYPDDEDLQDLEGKLAR